MEAQPGSYFHDARLPQQRGVDGVVFPAVLVPGLGGSFDEFPAAVRSEAPSRLEPLLLAAGAVLLRGFPTRTAVDFDGAVDAFGYEELPYVAAAPRTNVVGRVFTANESPPDQSIPFNHKMAQGCAAAGRGMKLEWTGDRVKTVTGPIPAVKLDERRGRKIWFVNMVAAYTGWKDSRNVPVNTVTFGDGSPLPADVIDECGKILEEECVAEEECVTD